MGERRAVEDGPIELPGPPTAAVPEAQASSSFLSDLFESLTQRGRALLRRRDAKSFIPQVDLVALGELLLSRRGEASGTAIAQAFLASYAGKPPQERLAFLKALADRFGPDHSKLDRAVESYRRRADPATVSELHAAAEPRRQELFRRLNMAPGGTAALIRMREDLLMQIRKDDDMGVVDADFSHLFSSWFNRGFLVLRQIDWATPANILEKIIRYEAVHEIRDWNDLRSRLEPEDRRCYGFFHPQLVDEPLIFVEVALTKDVPSTVDSLLNPGRPVIEASEANTAVFYSISNTQRGLGGVSFGNFLIKQVVETLKRELPNLKTFVTLSPVPGFANWLAQEREAEGSAILGEAAKAALKPLAEADWHRMSDRAESLRPVILHAAASYFLEAKNASGRPLDPVARFHLGNGARLERLNYLGDVSPKGFKQSLGLMVNYVYDLDAIEANHEAFAERGTIAASPAIRRLLRPELARSERLPS